MIAAAAFAGITALLALVVVARIMLAASPQASAESALSPGLDQANTLLLEQATADLALNAYVELERANSLDAYRQAIGRATTVLDELEKTVQGHSDLVDLVAGARTAQRTWVKTDAEPVVTLMEAGKRPRAMRETNSTEARAAFDAMTASARTLHDSVNAAREQAAASVADYEANRIRRHELTRPDNPQRESEFTGHSHGLIQLAAREARRIGDRSQHPVAKHVPGDLGEEHRIHAPGVGH